MEEKGQVIVENLTQTQVNTENDIIKCLNIGNENRKVAQTQKNNQSSRSHTVF